MEVPCLTQLLSFKYKGHVNSVAESLMYISIIMECSISSPYQRYHMHSIIHLATV